MPRPARRSKLASTTPCAATTPRPSMSTPVGFSGSGYATADATWAFPPALRLKRQSSARWHAPEEFSRARMFFLNLSLPEFLAVLGSLSGVVVALYLLDRLRKKHT